jgi:exonuclease VII small subunit
MLTKIIHITIPKDFIINDEINTFSPEENYLMLKIGSECLLESRKAIINLTQKEMHAKIKDEFKEEIDKLEIDLVVQKEVNIKMEENMEKIYNFQIENLTKKIDILNKQIISLESGNKEFVRLEVDKTKERCDILLEQKEKQIDKLSENYEKLILEKNKSVNKKGSEGEKKFKDYADTFKDFKGFKLIDKHTQGGEGDFHLNFEEFNILVDAKNYKTCVPGRERDKIKNDLLKNEHINFAWLVSLNTSIDKFDRAPIMTEWINTEKCVIYINNLLQFDDPKKILRIAWFYCNELIRLIEYTKENKDQTELKDVRDKQYKMVDKIKNARKNIRELNTTITVFKKQVDMLDYELKELISYESDSIILSNYSIFDDWWIKNIQNSNNSNEIISTDIWLKFKQDNKLILKDFELTSEKFKEYLKMKIPSGNIELKSNTKGAFLIKGIIYKKDDLSLENLELEI